MKHVLGHWENKNKVTYKRKAAPFEAFNDCLCNFQKEVKRVLQPRRLLWTKIKKNYLIYCYVCSYRLNLELYFFTSYEGIEEIVRAARRWTEPKSSCVRELIDSSPPGLVPFSLCCGKFDVNIGYSYVQIPMYRQFIQRSLTYYGKGALYLIKDDEINKYGRVEIQLHAFSVSLLHCGKWLVYNPANLRPETFLQLPMNMRILGPVSVWRLWWRERYFSFCCWKLNHFLRSTYSGLPTCFGSPGMPSSENPYVNTSSASELVQFIKH